MTTRGYFHTVIGNRLINQDAALVLDEVGLYAVADGVGGGLCGEVAAEMAVEHLKSVRHPDDLKITILQIQKAVVKKAMERFSEPIMGTTLTCVLVFGNELHFCHVGDSRCYLLRDNRLQRLTEDHECFDESMNTHVLSSYIGIGEAGQFLKIQQESLSLEPGDKILLCTDGLYRQLGEQRMIGILGKSTSPQAIAETLCTEAMRVEKSDNITVVYVEILEGNPTVAE